MNLPICIFIAPNPTHLPLRVGILRIHAIPRLQAAQVHSASGACHPSLSTEGSGWTDDGCWEEDAATSTASSFGPGKSQAPLPRGEQAEAEGAQGVFDDFDELQMPGDTEVPPPSRFPIGGDTCSPASLTHLHCVRGAQKY